MLIEIEKLLPKKINNKCIHINKENQIVPLGKKVKNFKEKIEKIKIKTIISNRNIEYIILNFLKNKEANYYDLMKNTKIMFENLRWYIKRKANSLLKRRLIKENRLNRKLIFKITEKGKKELKVISKNKKLPIRKKLILINENDEIVLINDWTSWLCPHPKEIRYNSKIKRFMWKIPKNKLLIQYEKTINSKYFTILPQIIEIEDELLITTLGLLKGEMRKKQGDISFTNTNQKLANYVLECLKKFGINKNCLKFDIQINTKGRENINKNKIMNFWIQNINIKRSDIRNLYEYNQLGTKRHNYGRIDFIYKNIILKEVINNLISNIMKTNNKRYIIHFLRGLIGAEGDVQKTKKDKIAKISIGSNCLNDKIMIKKMLSKININTNSIYKNKISIHSKINFKNVINNNLLKFKDI